METLALDEENQAIEDLNLVGVAYIWIYMYIYMQSLAFFPGRGQKASFSFPFCL